MIEEEKAIAEVVIHEFLDECLFEPGRNWPTREFENRSYERWAAKEILRRLNESPSTGVINAIQKFIEDLYIFEEDSDDWTSVRIFRLARETAEDILKLFL